MQLLESDKFKLGLFVTISFLMICIVFIIFGLFDFVSERAPVVSLFQESVQGLENGALVKYRGVPIGKVSDITISTKNNLIRVDMDVNLSKLRSESVGGVRPNPISIEEFYKFMEKEIKNGLRATLEFNGISGFKYIELDYKADKDKPMQTIPVGELDKTVFFIPSEPSMLSGIRSGITETIAKIASIDYKQLSEKVESVLNRIQELIADPNLKLMLKNSTDVTERLSHTVKNLNHALTPEKLDRLTDKLLQSMEQIRELSGKMDRTLSESKLAETSAAFRNAAIGIQDSEKAFNDTMAKFNDTMDAMSELIKTLDNNPSSVLSGKK